MADHRPEVPAHRVRIGSRRHDGDVPAASLGPRDHGKPPDHLGQSSDRMADVDLRL